MTEGSRHGAPKAPLGKEKIGTAKTKNDTAKTKLIITCLFIFLNPSFLHQSTLSENKFHYSKYFAQGRYLAFLKWSSSRYKLRISCFIARLIHQIGQNTLPIYLFHVMVLCRIP